MSDKTTQHPPASRGSCSRRASASGGSSSVTGRTFDELAKCCSYIADNVPDGGPSGPGVAMAPPECRSGGFAFLGPIIT